MSFSLLLLFLPPLETFLGSANRCASSSSGGLTVFGGQGKVEVNNTFEERLRLLEIEALPAVRETLFGKNLNRKFYN